MPFGSTGSFQLRKILSSKGVPFTDLAGIGPGTTNKIKRLKIGSSRDRQIKEMVNILLKTKGSTGLFLLAFIHMQKTVVESTKKALQSLFCHSAKRA